MVYKWMGHFDEGPPGLYDRQREGRLPRSTRKLKKD
jgi:hypothetical protein